MKVNTNETQVVEQAAAENSKKMSLGGRVAMFMGKVFFFLVIVPILCMYLHTAISLINSDRALTQYDFNYEITTRIEDFSEAETSEERREILEGVKRLNKESTHAKHSSGIGLIASILKRVYGFALLRSDYSDSDLRRRFFDTVNKMTERGDERDVEAFLEAISGPNFDQQWILAQYMFRYD